MTTGATFRAQEGGQDRTREGGFSSPDAAHNASSSSSWDDPFLGQTGIHEASAFLTPSAEHGREPGGHTQPRGPAARRPGAQEACLSITYYSMPGAWVTATPIPRQLQAEMGYALGVVGGQRALPQGVTDVLTPGRVQAGRDPGWSPRLFISPSCTHGGRQCRG